MFHALERSVVSRVSAGESEAAVSFGNGATWAAVARRAEVRGAPFLYGLVVHSNFPNRCVTCMWMGRVINM
jgi:hypothetical protein